MPGRGTACVKPKIDHFFSAVAARLDRWRDVNKAARPKPGPAAPSRSQNSCPWRIFRPLLRMNFQDEAQSRVPALGYTVPYAIGNILLTAWGPVIVALMSIGR